MECFFCENLSLQLSEVILDGEEFKHLKAMRIQRGDRICIVNGKGLSAFAYIVEISKNHCLAKIFNFVENLGEIESKIGLALGILDNKERFEFAFEKAIELRISDFYPLISKFTQKNKIEKERLIRKGISSIKQTYRSRIPIIHPIYSIEMLIKEFKNYEKVLVLDRNGIVYSPNKCFKSFLLIIGPEGGFSEEELRAFSRNKKVEIVKICDYPLRSETAVVGILSLITSALEKV